MTRKSFHEAGVTVDASMLTSTVRINGVVHGGYARATEHRLAQDFFRYDHKTRQLKAYTRFWALRKALSNCTGFQWRLKFWVFQDKLKAIVVLSFRSVSAFLQIPYLRLLRGQRNVLSSLRS